MFVPVLTDTDSARVWATHSFSVLWAGAGGGAAVAVAVAYCCQLLLGTFADRRQTGLTGWA